MQATIRTTHVGSLPRPPKLTALLVDRERDVPVDDAAFDEIVAVAVNDSVARQVRTGISIVNDGEMGKMTYATYMRHRWNGIEPHGAPEALVLAEFEQFPVWSRDMLARHVPLPVKYAVDGPLSIRDMAGLEADIVHLRAAADRAGARDVFMNAASPGIVALYIENRYYRSPEAYFAALADVLRPEYEAIVAAGFVLQLDCPDLSLHRIDAPAKHLAVDAINAATANIDPQRMRMHLCWGNYHGPHVYDLPLAEVFPFALRARPAAIAFEAANPRHEHEWAYFNTIALPDEKTLIPGIIDNTSMFVEHPELVAQRIGRFVQIVGAQRVIAGTDCGFATSAASTYDPDLAYAKLESLVTGAALAAG